MAGQPFPGARPEEIPKPAEKSLGRKDRRGRGRDRDRDRGRGRGRDRERGPGPVQHLEAVLPSLPPSGVHKVLLMNATDTGEIRVAILENGDLAEIFIERKSHVQQTGNIYKGRVVNVEPSLQAAFVDLGLERNGFLHASDCIPPDGGYSDLLKPGAKQSAKDAPAEIVEAPVSEIPAAPAAEGQPEAAPATVPSAGVPGEGKVPGNGKRRRRRRGGRGRSGRSRPSTGAAPMIAPTPDSFEPQSSASGEAPAAPPDPSPEPQPVSNEPSASSEPAPATPAPETHEEPAAPAAPAADTFTADSTAGDEEDSGSDSGKDGDEEQNGDEEESTEGDEGSEDAEKERGEEHETFPVDPAQPEMAPSEAAALGAAASAATAPGTLQPDTGAPRRPDERRGRDGRGGRGNGFEKRFMVQEMLKRGSEVLVQVAKEGMGQKGPALTTYLSLPGRYLVLMPAVQRLGVSKRIESEEQRRALKEILANLKTPEGMGVIVRTAGMGRSREELQRDLDFLMQKWDALKKKAQIAKAPAQLFQEGDVITRVFRDVLADDVSEIIVDDPMVMERAKEFVREMSPGAESKIKLYSDAEPMFHKHGVERQLQQLFNRKVALKGGGSIVIEQTEAMVAIDVNTGRFREKHSQDETILATNLEAAREIARQLRLRDIGGLVMVDFIDMDHLEHRRRVEREFKAHLARDKARINVMPISPLGIVEMTRQRVRHSLRRALFERCPHCNGVGQVKSPETLGLEVLRELRAFLHDSTIARVRVSLHSASACAILNKFRRELLKLEDVRGTGIEVVADDRIQPSQFQISTARAGGDFVVKRMSEVDDYVRNS
ncbi:MAG: Rne/Rng family ribonuclease [Planctomycetes bacterium]|nr:Rne/Rng family ribonuclease [Planctomycetota bacterium]